MSDSATLPSASILSNLWTFTLPNTAPTSSDGSPVVAGDRLCMLLRGSLYVADLNNGAQAFAPIISTSSQDRISNLLAAGTVVYFVQGGVLKALDVGSGQPLAGWPAIPFATGSTLSVSDGLLIVVGPAATTTRIGPVAGYDLLTGAQ